MPGCAAPGNTRTSTPGCPCVHEEVDVVSKPSVFKTPDPSPTVRLTVARATIRFLANQYVERDGERAKFFAGCFGIFGHGNVAGLGQALLQAEVEAAQTGTEPALRYVLGRNEQAMVHSAAAYARQKDRLQAWAVTASIGPGSTNMLTGAALATINRLPVLLLPSDNFATRVSAPVLQQLEAPNDAELTVNDAFKPLSRFFDRVWRPEQLPSALLGAMRVLPGPVAAGAAPIGRSDRVDGFDGRQRAGRPGRRGDRDRHPLQRFHQRLPHRLQRSRGAVRQHQRRAVRLRQAGGVVRGRRRARGDRRPVGDPGRLLSERRIPGAHS